MATTRENLMAGFGGESQANRRYLFFAEKAEREGHPQIARMFRAIAEAETVHARNHLRIAGEIKSTRENLLAAIEGERYEFEEMYPAFVQQAGADGNMTARTNFHRTRMVEEIHHGMYRAALESLEKGRRLEGKPIYICETCGHTVEGEPPDRCPICNAIRSAYRRVD